ncbi:MAG: type II secretion system protein [Alphaproteobacteria bacterium]
MRNGLSILEVALVLLIIGMMVGAVVIGRSLIRDGELRGAQSEANQIGSAVSLFQNKYNAMPGDMKTATSYWPGTNIGDGDFIIETNGGMAAEEFYAWRHLASAGMIPGYFTGASNSMPESSVTGGYYRLSYQADIYTTSAHMISLNAMSQTFPTAHAAILTPREARAMDLKADDGLADSGSLLGFNQQGVGGCATNDYTDGSGSYLISGSTADEIRCKVFFVLSN